jgi:Icc-related predicted phosphoesterase
LRAVVFSDLHLAFSFPDPFVLPDDTDVVIVAGDVSAPVGRSMEWLHKHIPEVPVIYVAGNHDHYGQVYGSSKASGIAARKTCPNVHYLEDEQVVIGGVRFLGATMWTDFELYGDMRRAMEIAHWSMNDFRQIFDLDAENQLVPWKPERTRQLHHRSRKWLREALAVPFDGPTVVVTHHSPHPLSVADEFRNDDLTPAFASSFDAEIRQFQPDLWVHGHTHTSFDYVVPETKTRVVCNPRGYVREYNNGRSVENMQFEMMKVVEV